MTLFDTSVIIDARDPQSAFHEWARQRIADAMDHGAVINTVALAEASVRVADREQFAGQLEEIGFILLPLPLSAAAPAAAAYALYLDRLKAENKEPRSKIPLGDFFIGAHAQAENMKLVTRDPARVATYFPAVEIIQP